MSETFSDDELKLINSAKNAMRIMAKIIRDKDVREVIKDEDLAQEIGNKPLQEALDDPELGKKIKARVTPDLPQLNPEQEALVICQLGSAVFGKLVSGQEDDGGPN